MGEHGTLKATYYVLVNGEWQCIGEIEDFNAVEAYDIQIEPTSLADTRWSFEIELDPKSRHFFWWLEWQWQKSVPKIARN